MHLPSTIFYRSAGRLKRSNPGFLLSPRRSLKPRGERCPPERYPKMLDRSRWAAYAVTFLFELFQVGAKARDLMWARTSAKRAPEIATSAIWNMVLLA